MYKKQTLNNGLRVITHDMPQACSVGLGIWINVGGRYESSGNKGIAHFLEHLLFKGSKNHSCRQIKESIEGVGGSLNGFTSEELTCYLVKIPRRYLGMALRILSDMVIHPVLEEADVIKERAVILEEIKMYKDQPQSYVYELLDELLWPSQPLGEPIAGTAESVGRINREDLVSFQRERYTPSNIVISASGAFEHDEFSAGVSRIFSRQKKRDKNVFCPAAEKQDSAQLRIFDKGTEQSHMALGFHSLCRGHALKHALGLLHIILGANMSSRLFNEVREKKGLAYEIGTLVKRYQDTGAFIVHAGIDNRRVSEAVQLILGELKKIREELIGPDEFRRSKDFYLGQLMLALEDTLDHMLWIGESTAILDRAYTLKDVIKEVNKVTREDIRKTARYLFKDEKINLALIGPLENNREKIINQLHLG